MVMQEFKGGQQSELTAQRGDLRLAAIDRRYEHILKLAETNNAFRAQLQATIGDQGMGRLLEIGRQRADTQEAITDRQVRLREIITEADMEKLERSGALSKELVALRGEQARQTKNTVNPVVAQAKLVVMIKDLTQAAKNAMVDGMPTPESTRLLKQARQIQDAVFGMGAPQGVE